MIQMANGRAQMKVPRKLSPESRATVSIPAPVSPWQVLWGPMSASDVASIKIFPNFRSPLGGYALLSNESRQARAVAASMMGTNSPNIQRAEGVTLLERNPLYDGVLLSTIARGWEVKAIMGGLNGSSVLGVEFWHESRVVGAGTTVQVSFACPLGLPAIVAVNQLREIVSDAYDSENRILDVPAPGLVESIFAAWVDGACGGERCDILVQSRLVLQDLDDEEIQADDSGPILPPFASLQDKLRTNPPVSQEERISWLVAQTAAALAKIKHTDLSRVGPSRLRKETVKIIQNKSIILGEHLLAKVINPAFDDWLEKAGFAGDDAWPAFLDVCGDSIVAALPKPSPSPPRRHPPSYDYDMYSDDDRIEALLAYEERIDYGYDLGFSSADSDLDFY